MLNKVLVVIVSYFVEEAVGAVLPRKTTSLATLEIEPPLLLLNYPERELNYC